MVPVLGKSLELKKKTFVNRIIYPDANSLLDYWRASTFHNPEFDARVAKDIEAHFANSPEFIVEKHVMAAIATKERS